MEKSLTPIWFVGPKDERIDVHNISWSACLFRNVLSVGMQKGEPTNVFLYDSHEKAIRASRNLSIQILESAIAKCQRDVVKLNGFIQEHRQEMLKLQCQQSESQDLSIEDKD